MISLGEIENEEHEMIFFPSFFGEFVNRRPFKPHRECAIYSYSCWKG